MSTSRTPNAQSRPPAAIGEREHAFAGILWRKPGLSRRDLHELTQTHPTLTGNAIASLINRGLIREGPIATSAGRGRPQVPLEVDPDRLAFIGLAISPEGVRVARVNAVGHATSGETSVQARSGQSPIPSAAALLRRTVDDRVLAIGVSVTGLVLPLEGKILFSSAIADARPVSISPLRTAAGNATLVLQNDMHALAQRWVMCNPPTSGDSLLVGVEDGRLGAALLLNGRPHGGVVSGANELGHTRLDVDTDPCYCGQTGCLERIVSTAQLARLGAPSGRTLNEVLAEPKRDAKVVERLLHLLLHGIANAVNFIRPHQLIIASPLVRHAVLADAVQTRLPAFFLPGLRDRVIVRTWEQSNVQSAENAAWLALADVFGHAVPEIH